MQSELDAPATKGMKMPRRVERHINHLDVYELVFGKLTSGHQHGNRIEIEIEHAPWNRLAVIRVHVPASILKQQDTESELLKISRERDGHNEFLPVEITGIKLEAGLAKVETRRGPNSTSIVVVPDSSKEIDGALRFEFVAWEVVGPTRGQAPYLVATLGVNLELGVDVDTMPAVVLLKTPRSVTPRSTQGSHVLAYPSHTTDEHRILGLYFSTERLLAVRYTSGGTNNLINPWEALARAAGSAALVFLVVSAAGGVSSGERFLAVLAAFLAAAQVSWGAAREIVAFSVYGRHRRAISAGVLATNLVLLATFVSALLGLSGLVAIPLEAVKWISLAVAAIAALGAIAGVCAHWAGSLHGYTCDFLGCRRSLGLRRRQRVECRYTGRVFCDEHIDNVCANCAHGPDLVGDRTDTLEQYKVGSALCRRTQITRHTGDDPKPLHTDH